MITHSYSEFVAYLLPALPACVLYVVAILRCREFLKSYRRPAQLAMSAFVLLLVVELCLALTNLFVRRAFDGGNSLSWEFRELIYGSVHLFRSYSVVFALLVLLTSIIWERNSPPKDSGDLTTEELRQAHLTSRARFVLTLGIVSVLVFPPAGLIAFVLASKSLDRDRAEYSSRQLMTLRIGYLLGALGTVITFLAILFILYLRMTTGKD